MVLKVPAKWLQWSYPRLSVQRWFLWGDLTKLKSCCFNMWTLIWSGRHVVPPPAPTFNFTIGILILDRFWMSDPVVSETTACWRSPNLGDAARSQAKIRLSKFNGFIGIPSMQLQITSVPPRWCLPTLIPLQLIRSPIQRYFLRSLSFKLHLSTIVSIRHRRRYYHGGVWVKFAAVESCHAVCWS